MALSPRARDLPARPSPGVNNATSSNTSSSDSANSGGSTGEDSSTRRLARFG